ncbi:alpha-1,6-mannosyltransferase Och1 [Pseudomassariella vexata]|uniref:Alpha-1,6-mannosyltransferase Och1 n=1 Tax=Pseudomassariella vexata TaxID=1141098 RepID=A0A1Y2EBX3_9PEZI|nr:alpha-1,6-mannosyltransferase Och1 [Pseudomassariella vexata]ORY68345.1 alpha-1,6-mannosyltransferase Och1 [Pseudomassariella vexata]
MYVRINSSVQLAEYDDYNTLSKNPTISTSTTTEADIDPDPLIPRKIWQIFFTERSSTGALTDIDTEKLSDTASWLAKNPDYTYTLVGSNGGDDFVRRHFADNWPILRTYRALKNPGLKSDLLRYLILSVAGGTYTDTDTEAYRPIDEWVPAQYRNRTRVVVGIEFDRLDGPFWADIPHDLQFCQWTIAAAPGHPLFSSMANRAVEALHELVRVHNTTLPRLKASSIEVMNSTGPAAWTDAVFEQLKLADPVGLTDLKNLSGITEPTLYGDILVLPIDGFGMGQPHSMSTNDGSIPEQALMRHHFRGSWRDD